MPIAIFLHSLLSLQKVGAVQKTVKIYTRYLYDFFFLETSGRGGIFYTRHVLSFQVVAPRVSCLQLSIPVLFFL